MCVLSQVRYVFLLTFQEWDCDGYSWLKMMTMISTVILEGERKYSLPLNCIKWGIQAWEKWVGTALGCGRGCTFSPPLPFSPWDGISLSTVAWGVDILLIHYKVTCNDDLLFRGGYFLAAASSSQVCSAPSCLWVVLSHCCSPEHSPIF